MALHDGGYKLFFSHKRMVQQLLTGYARGAWLSQAHLDTLEPVPTVYTADTLDQRVSDMLWRFRWGAEWVYVYLLLEFQSTAPWEMAIRVIGYQALLYQDIIRAGLVRPGQKLPTVLPLVLYNGSAPWTAAADVSSLIAPAPEGLEFGRLQGGYLVIDERRTPDNNQLMQEHNLVEALFRLEKSRTPEDIARVVECLAEWLATPEADSLAKAFTTWLNGVLIPARMPGQPAAQAHDLQEMRGMLTETVKQWTRDWTQEGVQQGMQQGMQKGEADMLLRQMAVQFGPLSDDVRQRVAEADSETLLRWGEKVLKARRIEDVLN